MAEEPAKRWVEVEWSATGSAYVKDWKIFIRLGALIDAVEREGYIVLPIEGDHG